MAETISVRLPREIKKELGEFVKDEKLTQTSEAARKLILMGLEEWRRKRALDLFCDGKVTFSKAAQISHLNVWEFMDLVKQYGRPWLKDPRWVEEDFKIRI